MHDGRETYVVIVSDAAEAGASHDYPSLPVSATSLLALADRTLRLHSLRGADTQRLNKT